MKVVNNTFEKSPTPRRELILREEYAADDIEVFEVHEALACDGTGAHIHVTTPVGRVHVFLNNEDVLKVLQALQACIEEVV